MDYPITVHSLYVSDGHNYFGRGRDPLTADQPGGHQTYNVDVVTAIAGRGLEGDRFFDVRPDFDGQVTFFSIEVFQALQHELSPTEISSIDLRRNVIIEGVPLNQLIDQRFSIKNRDINCLSTDGIVEFLGVRHCNPCRWMDIGVSKGSLKFLKGRGGLRAKVLSSGKLTKGPGLLSTSAPLDLTAIVDPLARPRLP